MARCVVDEDACQGHALCVFEAETIFGIRDSDGKAELLLDEIPDDLLPQLRSARDACPEQAIEVIE